MMTLVPVLLERAMPHILFAMYLITSFQICRYANWRDAGAPNPFLPRRVKVAVREIENRMRLRA